MSAFDRSRRLQQELPDLLIDIAVPRVPDYVDDILAQTAATRQRPRWTFLERWLPMFVVARRRVLVPSLPWRTLGAIAMLIVLLAAALLIAGSRPKVPAPFGLARNGALLYSVGGDLFVRDSIDGPARLVVGGPTDDFTGGFTRDGTRLTFLRRTAGTEGSQDERIDLMVANGDGTNVVDVSGALTAPDWWDLAPDDRSIIGIAGDPDQGQHLYRYDLQQPSEPVLIDLGPSMTVATPNFRGPDGREIIFRGRTIADGTWHSGLFALHADGTGFRALTPTTGDADSDYLFPQPSPDGRLVTYTMWDRAVSKNRIRMLDLTTGADRLVTADVLLNDGFASFSPDSKRITFVRYAGNQEQIMVMAADGGGPAIQIGPAYRQLAGHDVGGSFSPDGTQVIVNDSSLETRIVDATTGGEGRVLDWSRGSFAGWQRLAP